MFLSANDPVNAVMFCVLAQKALLECTWPQEILDFERTREERSIFGALSLLFLALPRARLLPEQPASHIHLLSFLCLWVCLVVRARVPETRTAM